MQQVRGGVVAHRVRAAFGVDDRVDRLPYPQPPVERAALDDESTDRSLGVRDGQQLAPTTGLPDHALIPDLAAALGIERRLVEDDLRLAMTGQLVVFHAVAHDRHDPPRGGRRLVAEELRVPDAGVDGPVQRAEFGLFRKLGLGPAPAPVALLGKGQIEPIAIDGDAVLGGQLDGQVDREPVGVVQLEGDVAGQLGGVDRQVVG